MEEDEYKTTYQELARIRCVFEKTLTNNQGQCRFSRHFWLAEREGYACKSEELASKCSYLLEKLRERSRFLLKVHSVGSQLPHNVDIRVQVGGLQGLSSVLGVGTNGGTIDDIWTLIDKAGENYTSLDDLPYSEIVQAIARYKVKTRSRKKT